MHKVTYQAISVSTNKTHPSAHPQDLSPTLVDSR